MMQNQKKSMNQRPQRKFKNKPKKNNKDQQKNKKTRNLVILHNLVKNQMKIKVKIRNPNLKNKIKQLIIIKRNK